MSAPRPKHRTIAQSRELHAAPSGVVETEIFHRLLGGRVEGRRARKRLLLRGIAAPFATGDEMAEYIGAGDHDALDAMNAPRL
jgi:hypothetical protein